jgi:DNA-binding transcriptional LysR family regulator
MINPASISRLRLRHIHCLLAIARERHLGRAADSLGLTQPAVSKTLSELEDILGVRVVERGRFGAALTPRGEEFLGHAQKVIDSIEEALYSARPEAGGQSQHVRVGALPTVAPALLPKAIDAFRRARPRATVTVNVSANAALLEELKTGRLDFIIGRMADPQAMIGLSFDLMYVEPLTVVVGRDHPLAAHTVPSLSEVLGYPLIVATPGTVPRHRTESFLSAHGARLSEGYVETLSVSLGRLLALTSQSVWFAPLGAVADDLARGELVRLGLDTAGTEEPVGLVRRSQHPLGPVAADMAKAIRETVAAR